MRPALASHIVLSVQFFTKTSASILTRWLLFKNLHNRTGLIKLEAYQHLIERLHDDTVVFFSDEAHFHIVGASAAVHLA